jgi:hypothetical protein
VSETGRKTCTKCKRERLLDDFGADARRPGGKQSQCRECQSRRIRERYATDPEVREKRKAYARARHQENRDEELARRREYHREHRDEENARRSEYYQENRDRQLDYHREHYREHADDVKVTAAVKTQEYQAETLPHARRYGYQWTGPELELAARDDLPLTEIARMLGRSYKAVVNARYEMRRDPRYRDLAGLRQAS